jgi:outer membrane receptor protein involved in Fe transport
MAVAPAEAAPPEPPPAEDIDADLAGMLDQSVVTTASKQAEIDALAPATVLVVTADEMRRLGITSLDDVLNYFGVGMTYQSPTGTGVLGVRGVMVPEDGGNHVLVLVDGHAMNEPWGGWQLLDRGLGVPWEIVDHVEIVLGPGSVLYGTNAMQAVINVVTQDAAAFEGVHVSAQAGVSPPVDEAHRIRGVGGGYGLGYMTRAAAGYAHPFEVGGRPGGVSVQLEHYQVQGPPMHYGPQPAEWDAGPYAEAPDRWGGIAGIDLMGFGGLVRVDLGDFSLRLLGNLHSAEDPVASLSDFADPDNAVHTATARGDLRHQRDLTTRVALASRLYGDYMGYVGRWIYSDPDACGYSVRCDWREIAPSAWGGIEEQLLVDWLVDGRLTTLLGVGARLRWVGDRVSTRELAPGASLPELFADRDATDVYFDWQDTSAAGTVYLQQTYQPLRVIGFNAGARLDLDQTLRRAHVSPRAAVVASPSPATHVKLVYAEAFRAPGVGEIRYYEPAYWLPAGTLEPETVRSLELTGKQDLVGGRGFVEVGGFYSWWDDLIAASSIDQTEFDQGVEDGILAEDDDIDGVSRYKNLGRIRAYGGLARLHAHTRDRRFSFGSSFSVSRSWQEAQNGGVRPRQQPIPMVPDVIANLRASWWPGGAWPTFAVAAFYNSRRNTVEGVEGYFVRPALAPHHVQGRLALTGEIPRTLGLGWGVWADYSFARSGAVLVGQSIGSDDPSDGGELAPISRLWVMAGLRWDFSVHGARARRGGGPTAAEEVEGP